MTVITPLQGNRKFHLVDGKLTPIHGDGIIRAKEVPQELRCLERICLHSRDPRDNWRQCAKKKATGSEYCALHSKKNPAAVALGSIKSAKKAETSRENGKKGGRPRE